MSLPQLAITEFSQMSLTQLAISGFSPMSVIQSHNPGFSKSPSHIRQYQDVPKCPSQNQNPGFSNVRHTWPYQNFPNVHYTFGNTRRRIGGQSNSKLQNDIGSESFSLERMKSLTQSPRNALKQSVMVYYNHVCMIIAESYIISYTIGTQASQVRIFETVFKSFEISPTFS